MKYQVSGRMTVSCWCEVEAETPEEAQRLASELDPAELQISGGYPVDESWHFTNDGTPEITDVEPITWHHKNPGLD